MKQAAADYPASEQIMESTKVVSSAQYGLIVVDQKQTRENMQTIVLKMFRPSQSAKLSPSQTPAVASTKSQALLQQQAISLAFQRQFIRACVFVETMEEGLSTEQTEIEYHQRYYTTDKCPPPFPSSHKAPKTQEQRFTMSKALDEIENLVTKHYMSIRHISEGNERFCHIVRVFIRPLLESCQRWEMTFCWKCRPNFQEIQEIYRIYIDHFNQLVRLQVDLMKRTQRLKNTLSGLIFYIAIFREGNPCVRLLGPRWQLRRAASRL